MLVSRGRDNHQSLIENMHTTAWNTGSKLKSRYNYRCFLISVWVVLLCGYVLVLLDFLDTELLAYSSISSSAAELALRRRQLISFTAFL